MRFPVLTPVVVVFLLFLVARRSELFGELVPATSRLPTLRLRLEGNAMADMQRALRTGDPQLGHQDGGDRPYFPGDYLDESGQLQDCKVSLRGLMSSHHHPEKPSLRVRIKRKDVARGRRYVELQRPEDVLALRNWIPVELARGMGLVTELIDHVRVFANGRYMGVYLRTTRAGEPLALENGRMPGVFFKGDAVGTRLGMDLWTDIDAWDTFPSKGEEVVGGREAMQDLLEALQLPPSVETLGRVASSLDMEAYARWAALMIVTGSLHADRYHNQVYFWCSNQGLLEPTPWDANSFGTHATPDTPVNVVLTPVMDMAIRDPRWVHRRNQIIGDLIQGSASREALHGLIDRAVDRMRPDLEADRNLSSLELVEGRWVLIPATAGEIDEHRKAFGKWVDERLRFLETFLADARVTAEADPQPGWSRVLVSGNVGIRAERRDGAPLEGQDGRDARVLLPGLGAELDPVVHKVAVPHPHAGPLAYRVQARPEELLFFNAITEQPVEPRDDVPADDAPQATRTRSVHPWDFPAETTGEVVLGPGDIALNQDLHVGDKQQLTIRAGTTIKLAAGVGIYSRGLTRVEGRADAPVVLEPASESPWGAFAVTGPATAGSSFAHMQMHGGSQARDGHVRYKGMFSVYNCPDVTIASCWFGANASGDDAVNLAESHIEVENCQFRGAPGDALDADMCTGRIAFCDFEGSGNDGLDLMACRILVEQCTFTGCGDKGISIGERSRVVVRRSEIVRCQIGIESKDDSRALIENSSLRDNRIAFHAFQKKWIYNRGGRGCLMDCEVGGSTPMHVSLERRTRLDLVRTQIRVADSSGKRIREHEALPDHWLDLWEAWR